MKKLVVAFACMIISAPATAEGPKGVAFVEAPEQSSGMCFSDNADKAFQCAKQKCTENGTLASDCLRVRWCYPSGWSADVFVQHKEGPHWHEYLCGWQSKEDLEKAAKLKCEGSLKPWLIECAVVGMWNPDGEPQIESQEQ